MELVAFLSDPCVISNFGFQVIQRKLVHVVTPSTASDGNIGPDAVHLLSVKEVCMLFYWLPINISLFYKKIKILVYCSTVLVLVS